MSVRKVGYYRVLFYPEEVYEDEDVEIQVTLYGRWGIAHYDDYNGMCVPCWTISGIDGHLYDNHFKKIGKRIILPNEEVEEVQDGRN